MAQKLGFYEATEPPAPVEKVLDEVNLDGIVKWIKSERCKNIITLSGAGISTCKYEIYNILLIIWETFNYLNLFGHHVLKNKLILPKSQLSHGSI